MKSRTEARSVQALTLALGLLVPGCCACPARVAKEVSAPTVRAGTGKHQEPYVIVVHGLEMEEAFDVRRLLAGLDPLFDTGGFSIDVGVPRSNARQAYSRILKSPMRNCGVLVKWKD